MQNGKLTSGLNGRGIKEEELNIKNWSVIKISITLKFMDKEKWNWSLSVGFYPGLLFGCRAYEEKDRLTYVFYLPFIDIALELPYK
tara:strand:- start:48 stop:305 length:258 start_codon:yes stop_codon:yes gene_type:complete